MSEVATLPRLVNGLYPERRDKALSALDRIGAALFDGLNRARPAMLTWRRVSRVIERYGQRYRDMDETGIDTVIAELRYQLRRQGLMHGYAPSPMPAQRRLDPVARHDCRDANR